MVTTHAAGRHHVGTYAHLVHGRHIRVQRELRWWRSERGRAIARDLGDAVDEIQQLAAVVLCALLVLVLAALCTAAVWPVEPHLASGLGVALVVSAVIAVLVLRRRP